MSTPSAFQLDGSITATPATGAPSGLASTTIPLWDQLNLVNTFQNQVDLAEDGQQSIGIGGLDVLNVVQCKVTGGYVDVALTTPAGTLQLVRCDDTFLYISQSVGATALSFTRQPATPVSVSFFLGQIA